MRSKKARTSKKDQALGLTSASGLVSILGMAYEIGDVVEEYDDLLDEDVTYEVQSWDIENILYHVSESADFPEFDGSSSMWAYLIASKGGDHHTPILIERILEEGFTDPICLYRTEYGGWGLGNGHHRLAAAILLGLDSIPVLVGNVAEAYFPDASTGFNFVEKGLGDEASANMIYKAYGKIFKKLAKQEMRALDEEAKVW
jgi:hypothetical protein